MSARRDGKAVAVLVVLVLLGLGLLAIPFFLTPPAFLEVALRDPMFSADLSGRAVQVVDDSSGTRLSTAVQKADGGGFFTRLGRINSGPGSFTVEVDGYEPAVAAVDAPPLQTFRAAVDLVPNFGRVEVTVVNATRTDQPVNATLKQGRSAIGGEPKSVFVVDLKPGKHQLSAEAPGFCPGEREIQVQERKVTRVKLPLSPDLSGDEIARLILDWGANPRDLDAHFLKVGKPSAHVYFSHKEGRNEANDRFAVLDVDYLNSEGYETVTVYDKAQGEYEYYVDHYAGSGTIGGSGAQVSIMTHGCQRRTYSVPAGCSQKIWSVARLRAQSGRIDVVDQQRCEAGTSMALGGKAP